MNELTPDEVTQDETGGLHFNGMQLFETNDTMRLMRGDSLLSWDNHYYKRTDVDPLIAELKRQLSQAQEAIRELDATVESLVKRNDELEQFKADAEMLDWLVIGGGKDIAARVVGSDERGWSVCDCSNGLTFASRDHKTYRDAIRAAISQQRKSQS